MAIFLGDMMTAQYDDPVTSHLTEASRKIEDVHLDIPSKLLEGKYHFGGKMYFTEIASAMKMWRIQVSEK